MAMIYCVEDDDGIRELISCALKSGGFDTLSFPSAKEFYDEISKRTPSLVLLDVMLPDEDGFMILNRLKNEQTTKEIPVIMLTAKDSELDKVQGLEAGADDYITKPFGVMELLSRIKAVLRRSAKDEDIEKTPVITIRGLSLDEAKRQVLFGSTEIPLTYKEFELLKYFMKHESVVISRNKLMERVWGFDFEGETRTVDMHIKTLRQKLKKGGCEGFIKTVRGIGYKI